LTTNLSRYRVRVRDNVEMAFHGFTRNFHQSTMNDTGRGTYRGGTALLNNSTNLHGQFEKFMRAARAGDTKTLTEIYETNKRILQSRAAFGSTCVHIAAENGRINALEWLRDRGADFGAKTRPRNQTPMHFAAARGQTQTLMWLCENTQALGCAIDAEDYKVTCLFS
jgi:ankyrin repeat protein